jgi:hypothetical protein
LKIKGNEKIRNFVPLNYSIWHKIKIERLVRKNTRAFMEIRGSKKGGTVNKHYDEKEDSNHKSIIRAKE